MCKLINDITSIFQYTVLKAKPSSCFKINRFFFLHTEQCKFDVNRIKDNEVMTSFEFSQCS